MAWCRLVGGPLLWGPRRKAVRGRSRVRVAGNAGKRPLPVLVGTNPRKAVWHVVDGFLVRTLVAELALYKDDSLGQLLDVAAKRLGPGRKGIILVKRRENQPFAGPSLLGDATEETLNMRLPAVGARLFGAEVSTRITLDLFSAAFVTGSGHLGPLSRGGNVNPEIRVLSNLAADVTVRAEVRCCWGVLHKVLCFLRRTDRVGRVDAW